MSRYVNADAFIADKLTRYCSNCDRRKSNDGKRFIYEIGEAPCRACWVGDMMDELEYYPTADVEEVRHGEWIVIKYQNDVDSYLYEKYKCSVCGTIEYRKYKYCHCGAKMDEGTK